MKKNLLTALTLCFSLFSITACGDDKEQAVKSYDNVQSCTGDIATDASSDEREKVTRDCQTAFDQSAVEHERSATHYPAMDSCSALYERCVPAHDGNGYVPFMTGFMLGYMSGGSPIYHPYYYDRYHVVYTGSSRLGYYRSGYVVAAPGATWTRSYAATPVSKGAAVMPAPPTRGVFGGTASAFGTRSSGFSNPASPSGRASSSISSPSASGRASSSISSPSGGAARGVFGGSAASAASSSSG